jgi:RNA 2',3'-cyclic 3'-phosphodiesterase
VTSPGSVGDRDRARIFVGLPLPPDVVEPLARWQQLELRGRLVAPQNLHVTLAFLGSRPVGEVGAIAAELREAAAAAVRPVLSVGGYRETRSVGMLVLEDLDGRAAALAGDLHGRLERLGVYRREARPWLPHLTVLRFRERPRLRPALPDLGEIGPSEAAVYHSVLRPGGAQYEVLESVALGG